MRRAVWAALCAVGALTMAGRAVAADVFTLQSTNGGDGYVTLLPTGFDLFGANNGFARYAIGGPTADLSSLTAYTATAGSNETLSFDWTYMTHDLSGAGHDPGGYLLNGVMHEVSPPSSDPINYNGTSGSLTLNLTAGDSYGFYIYTRDSEEGRGDILVTPTTAALAAVPEPATWLLLIGGFFGLGVALRRRRGAAAVTA